MKVLVVDDERPALDEMAYLLDQDPHVTSTAVCDSSTEALRLLQDDEFDLVLLDIAMPGLDGLELARVLGRFREPPAVVFVTAHEEHAVEAFALRAVDYLLKPIRPARLGEAIGRVASHERSQPVAEQAPPPAAATSPVSSTQIPVELGGVTRFVDRRSVTHVAAEGDYVRLHTPKGSHLMRRSLASLEADWAEHGFVRIHRSMLVSLGHVTEVRSDSGRCSVVVAGTPLAVSRRHTRELRDLLLQRSP